MQVYKAFFKIVQNNLSQIIIYIVIFLFFAVLLSVLNVEPQTKSFKATKCKIAFINHDTDSKLIEGLKDNLSENATFVTIEDETQKLQDALFFRKVEYIIRVPACFTENLRNGIDVQLQKTAVPNSTSSIYIDNLVNKYMNTAKIYMNHVKNLSNEQLVSAIANDLSQNTQVQVTHFSKQTSTGQKSASYFNYLAYSLFSILILGVCSVMMVLNQTDLNKRNLCSPVKLRNMNFQIVLGNSSFALIAWFVMIFTSFIMYGSYMFTINGLLLLLNSFIFTLAALSISFLIGNILKSQNAMSAAANVVALGSCFISGVFVPQELLGTTVLSIASFTPTYWYVKANNAIVNVTNFNSTNLMPVLANMLIVLGFAVAVLAITLVITKQKRTSA